MKNIKDLMDRDVIHCPTEEEAIAILKLAHEAGYTWCNEDSYIDSDNLWYKYKADMCYNIRDGSYSDLPWYKSSNYTIHKASEFLNKTNMKKIVGYTCPMDLFNGEVKKGTIYKKKGHYINWEPQKDGNISNYTLPEEIVTQWEAVYEDVWEPKVGDWVYQEPHIGDWREKKYIPVFRIEQFIDPGYMRPVQGYATGCIIKGCRKATKEEVQIFLISEAQKRGFKNGVKYKCTTNKSNQIFVSFDKLRYYRDDDNSEQFTDGYGGSIYKDGIWAEIIIKPDIVKIQMYASNGDFELQVSKEGIYYEPENQFINPEDIALFAGHNKLRHSTVSTQVSTSKYYSVSIDSINVGCKKNTKLSDWKKVYDKWKELQTK